MTRLLLLCVLLLGLAYWTVIGTVSLIGTHAGHLVGLVIGGYDKLTRLHVKTTLERLASTPSVRSMSKEACDDFQKDFEVNKNFFAVIAVGDKDGNAICTADRTILGELPTMSDRLYFQKAKESDTMITGEYALSKTTNKPVLHYAFPIREDGTFRGIVMAAVDLRWFVDPDLERYFHKYNIQVMSVDQTGHLLYGYPTDEIRPGDTVLTPQDVSVILSAPRQYRLSRGHDGVYRVYVDRILSQQEGSAVLVIVGIPVAQFIVTALLVGMLATGSIAYVVLYAIRLMPQWWNRKR